MPPGIHLPHTVPDDVVLEQKEDASTVAEDLQQNVRSLQTTLCVVSESMNKLNVALKSMDTENHKLRHENSMLQAQLAHAGSGKCTFAGTGEMPPTPRDSTGVMRPGQQANCVTMPDSDDLPACLYLDATGQSFYSYGMRVEQTPSQVASPTGMQAQPSSTEKLAVPALKPAAAAKKMKRQSTYGALRGVFADPGAMKEAVRKAIARPTFDVTVYYHERGWFQWIARSALFEYVTLSVIFINAIWIAIDCEYNTGDSEQTPLVFTVADHIFCAYFFIELVIRCGAFEVKCNVMRDAWFRFDFCLVLLMIIETWFLPCIFSIWGPALDVDISDSSLLRTMRLLRIMRMARMVKLLRCVPELVIVIKGIGVALRSVMYAWLLMVAVIYVFAIAFRQIAYGTELGRKYFDGVGEAMYTLLLRGALPDLAEFMVEVGDQSVGLAIVLGAFILLVTLTVMNMLIGVLVDVVGTVSKVENYELQVAFVKQRLEGMMEETGMDEDGNHRISKTEFGHMLVKPEAARILNDLGVDPVGLVDVTDFIFKEEDELDFPAFMDVILQLRGSNTATVRDMVDMRKWVAEEFRQLERSLGLRCRGGAGAGHTSPKGEAGPNLRMNTPNGPSRPAWDAPPSALKKGDSGPVAQGLNTRTVTVVSSHDSYTYDQVKPLMRHGDTALHNAVQEGLRARKGAAISSWRPGVEDDIWDEEV